MARFSEIVETLSNRHSNTVSKAEREKQMLQEIVAGADREAKDLGGSVSIDTETNSGIIVALPESTGRERMFVNPVLEWHGETFTFELDGFLSNSFTDAVGGIDAFWDAVQSALH